MTGRERHLTPSAARWVCFGGPEKGVRCRDVQRPIVFARQNFGAPSAYRIDGVLHEQISVSLAPRDERLGDPGGERAHVDFYRAKHAADIEHGASCLLFHQLGVRE